MPRPDVVEIHSLLVILALAKLELRKKTVTFLETYTAGCSTMPISRVGGMQNVANFFGLRAILAKARQCCFVGSLIIYLRWLCVTLTSRSFFAKLQTVASITLYQSCGDSYICLCSNNTPLSPILAIALLRARMYGLHYSELSLISSRTRNCEALT